jgi:hypothetical protein
MKTVRSLIAAGSIAISILACSGPSTDGGGFAGGSDDGGTDGGSSGASSSNANGSSSGGPSSSGTSGGGSSGGGTSGGNGSGGNGSSTSSSSGGPATGTDSGAPRVDAGVPVTVGTISTVDIPVAAGAELVKCQNFQNPFGKDVAIVESDSEMVSSHHMFVFHDPSFNMNTNSVADCSGIEFHDLLHMSQTPNQVMSYPPGVGHSLAATDGLRILVHLLNPSAEALTAHVTVNFQAVAPNQVQYVAVGLFLNNSILTVPTGVSTQSRTFPVPSDIEVLIAVSHMHRRGTAFAATTSTGATIYQGMSWDEPVPIQYKPPMAISAGTVITWACTYNNMTGMTLTFGESANTSEMCILAGMAYPKTAGVSLGTTLESVL